MSASSESVAAPAAELPRSPARDARSARARRTGVAATIAGALHVAVSVYWALGGRLLLRTVGRSLGAPQRSDHGALTVTVWGAIVIKLLAVLLPLLAVRWAFSPGGRAGAVRLAAWTAAAVLTAYGFVLTGVGLLVQAGIFTAGRHADTTALAWHAYLWDPWFLAWGLLLVLTLRGAGVGLRPRSAR